MLKVKKQLFSHQEYLYWSDFYYEKYGWFTIPRTGKGHIFLGNPKIENGFMDFSEVKRHELPPTYEKYEDWRDYYSKIAKSGYLTGIAVNCKRSNMIQVDFDNMDFYRFWQSNFKINTLTTATKRGVHCLFLMKTPRHLSFHSEFYSLSSQGSATLPPSRYYRYGNSSDVYEYDPFDTFHYKWLNSCDILEVDWHELNLIPAEIYDHIGKPSWDNSITS